MKIKIIFGQLFVALLTAVGLTACSDDSEEGTKITDYKEYTLTVASSKLPGVLTSGTNVLASVYAVKKEQSTEWEAFGSIGKFEYKEGNEYQIRISETSYLDYRMGDPAWTEYELLEVLSKEHKDSENLPFHFIPDWYFGQSGRYIDPEFAYAIEADQEEEIENDLMTDTTYKFGGLHYYITLPVSNNWFLLDSDMNTVEKGILISRSKDSAEFPETYKLLKPEQQVVSSGQFDFVAMASEDLIMQYDVFICHQSSSKSALPASYDLWLYRDLTAYYQNKFPEANIKAVVIRYMIRY